MRRLGVALAARLHAGDAGIRVERRTTADAGERFLRLAHAHDLAGTASAWPNRAGRTTRCGGPTTQPVGCSSRGSLCALAAGRSPVCRTCRSRDPAGGAIAAVPLPANATDLYIVLYGTGMRNYRNISASLDASKPEVVYVGAQAQFPGLDQINLHLKAPLHLSGTESLQLQVDGISSNAVSVEFQ